MAIETKIFIGFLINSEIKNYLKKSKRWQEEKVGGQNRLIEASNDQKEFLGMFIPSLLTSNQLKEKEEEIKAHLKLYCPKIDIEKQKSYLISQLFIQ